MEAQNFGSSSEKSCIKKSSFTSEYRKQFKNSGLSGYRENFEKPISHEKPAVFKELYEHGNNILPTNISTKSTYRSEYHPNFMPEQIVEPLNNDKKMFKFPEGFSINIDPNSNCYSKYLDIYATTNVLDFRNHINNEVKTDAITTWDWFRIPKFRGKSVEVTIPICKSDLDTSIQFKRARCNKFIPYRGLLSEQQEEFSYNSLTDPQTYPKFHTHLLGLH